MMRAIFKRFSDGRRGGRRCVRSAQGTLAYLYRERKDAGEVLAVEGRFPAGVVTGSAEVDALALSGRAPVGKNQVVHFVVAAAEKTAEKEKLLKAGHDLGRYLARDGRGYVAVVHAGHVHVAVENYAADGRALHLSARDMHQLRSLSFTKEFEPNPKTGNFKGASQVHPESKRLVARSLALRLVNEETSWQRLLQTKEITPARVGKAGELLSFSCRDERGREIRVRVATVEKLAQRERVRRAEKSASKIARQAGAGLFNLADDLADAVSQVEQPQSKGRAR